MVGKSINSLISKISLLIFYGLLAYMPFHVFLATWLGSSLGILELAKVAKEPILVIGIVLALYSARGKLASLYKKFKVLFWLIAALGLISVIAVILNSNEFEAEILGLTYNTRYLVFFVYGAILTSYFGKRIVSNSARIVLYSGVLVAILGLFQVFILPDTSLANFGYSRETGTPAAFYVNHEAKETERAYSTLKDPNSLGSYLVIIISMVLVTMFNRSKNRPRAIRYIAILIILLGCLYLTYSRSAIVGLAAGLATLVMLSPQIQRIFMAGKRKYITFSAILVIPAVALYLISGTYFFQSVVLHDVEGKEQTSNTLRLAAYKEGMNKIIENPMGTGVGSAGPVSFKNESKGVIIPENYYMQIALEVGIIGLLIFLSILVYVGYHLYVSASAGGVLAIALLVSLVGVSIANIFNHLWANEAVAYTWWGLAGLSLGAAVIKPSVRR